MNTNHSNVFTSVTLDNVLAAILVVAILGACAAGVFDVVRMMSTVA